MSSLSRSQPRPAEGGVLAPSIWSRWQLAWHLLFYILLLLCTLFTLFDEKYAQAAYLELGLLLAVVVIWYAGGIRISSAYWEGHPYIAMGYLLLGWLPWFGLTMFSPIYLFLLASLYPQAFQVPRMPWKFIACCLLTALCLWRQYIEAHEFNVLFFISLALGASSVVMGVFITSVIEQSQQRQRLIQQLEETRAELAQAERQNGVLEERRRLASEIHDTLAQGFTGIIMNLESAGACSSETTIGALGPLDKAYKIARENLLQTRSLMWALQPELFAQNSLPEALAQLVKRWSDEQQIAQAFTITGKASQLRPEIEVTLLQAAQEALTNVHKHAQACHVAVTLSYMDDIVMLDVQDNGKGFEPGKDFLAPIEQLSGHFGLHSLHKRIEQLSGELSLESAPGEGTTLTVTLPHTRL